MSLHDSYQTEARAWAGAAGLGVGGLLGQTVTRVAGGEEVIGQDWVVFLEVCQQFRTVRMQRDRRSE